MRTFSARRASGVHGSVVVTAKSNGSPAVFLDRDGVLLKNLPGYIRGREDVTFLPGAFHALRLLSQTKFKIFLVTNQSMVGRGFVTLKEAEAINDYVVHLVVQNEGRIDQVYMCPHAPDDNCDCRKPMPGLILQAEKEFSLDLSKSILIGDALSDIQAAKAAGIGKAVLVKTGRGHRQSLLPLAGHLGSYDIFDNLDTAIANLLSPADENSSFISP
jgi:D-glycero-D-manno-heptose 1,7-bisphosphate phosphatase